MATDDGPLLLLPAIHEWRHAARPAVNSVWNGRTGVCSPQSRHAARRGVI